MIHIINVIKVISLMPIDYWYCFYCYYYQCLKYFSNNYRPNYPVSIYLLKVNNRKTRTKCEICSKLAIKTPERRQWRRSGVKQPYCVCWLTGRVFKGAQWSVFIIAMVYRSFKPLLSIGNPSYMTIPPLNLFFQPLTFENIFLIITPR